MTAAEVPDLVMRRIAAAQELAAAGDWDAARAAFAGIWADLGEDGDPLHVVSLAHYMADLQDDPRTELEWDLRALRAAHRLTDGLAQQYRGFFPSLHLNVAAAHAKLGERDAAARHLTEAEAALPALADDGYGQMIRSRIERLRAELAVT